MWKCSNCQEHTAEAPCCCTGGEVPFCVDKNDRAASPTGSYIDGIRGISQEEQDEWETHDCAPVCSECGNDLAWS